MEKYSPNVVPAIERVFAIVWALGLLTWGAHGLYVGELVVPGLRGGDGLPLAGISLVIIVAAILFGIVSALLPVIDHYDKRDNELIYIKVKNICNILSVVLIIIATSISHFGS
jgi:hypothetical protein